MKKTIIYYSTILFIAINIFSTNGQSVKKAFKSLEKMDYAKAHEEFQDVLSKDRNNAAAKFGLTYLYGFEEFGMYDIFKAWEEVEPARKAIKSLNSEDAEIANEYFIALGNKTGNAKYKMDKYLDEIETAMLRTMREENNLEVVYKFLEEFKDFEHYENIIHIRNYLEYRNAEEKNTLAAIQEFIEKRPDAAQIELAKEKVHELAFKEAKAKNSSAVMEQFINTYPNAIQLPDAITIRNKLEYEKVLLTNNFDAFQQYVEKYPNSMYIPQLKEKQKRLVYEEARKINTLEAYNKFISMYPDGAQYIDIFNLKTVELGKKFNNLNTDFTAPLTWTRGFDSDGQNDIATTFCTTANGETIIAGATMQDDTSEYLDAWIIKLDPDKKMVWNRIIGEHFHDIPNNILTDYEGNIIVSGIINKVNDTTDGKAWIFKLDPKGDKIWNRKLDMPEILSMDVNTKGEIILGGYQYNDTLPENYVLYKLTKQGRKFWRRSYSTFGKVNDLAITTEDDIIVGGSQWIWKLNNQGYLIWESTVAENDSIVSLTQIANGNIAVLGKRDSNQCLIKILSPKGKPVLENSFGANASYCLPIEIEATASNLIFAIKLDNYNKLIYSDLDGNLTNEFDFSPNVISTLAGLKKTNTGKIGLILTAENLGQKKDIIISEIQ